MLDLDIVSGFLNKCTNREHANYKCFGCRHDFACFVPKLYDFFRNISHGVATDAKGPFKNYVIPLLNVVFGSMCAPYDDTNDQGGR